MHAVEPQPRQWNWISITFLAGTFLLGTAGTALYTLHTGLSWWMPALFLASYAFAGMGICAGYHRFYAHPTHRTTRFMEYYYLIAGACALQREVGQWASSHRIHHKFTDTDKDPYDISRGFWWAHIGWVLEKRPDIPVEEWPKDLRENPLVLWQQRWYWPLGLGVGFLLPLFAGYLMGDVLAGLFWGGFTRIVMLHHSTFFVNSLAHMVGTRPYSLKESARDNALVAFVSLGEGFHNFHHAFMLDWRNGIRWYQFDPAKWLIGALHRLGLAELRFTTPPEKIERRRLEVARQLAAERLRDAPPTFAARVEAHLACAERCIRLAFRPRPHKRRALVRRARREQKHALSLAKRLPLAA